MRIGIEAQRLMRKRKHGMDIVALELIRYLQQIDRKNEYIIFTKMGDDESCIEETGNFKIVKTGNYLYPVWEQFVLPFYCKKYDIDILHCTSNTAPLFIKVPLVLTLHDIIFMSDDKAVWKGGSYYQNLGNLYRRYLVPRLIEKCLKIITVSEFAKDEISEFFDIKDDRLIRIYNGINRIFSEPVSEKELEKVKNEYDLPENFIFFLGNTAPKKNLRGVLQAYALHTSREFKDHFPLVMTDLSEDFLNKELEILNLTSIKKDIRLVGYINQRKLSSFYRLSTCFLYPSLAESFGLPMIEAMACETPVITSNNTSMPEVSGGCALYVDPYQPTTIGKAMMQIVSDDREYEKMVACGLKRAEDFSFRKMAEQVHQVYSRIFGEKEVVV